MTTPARFFAAALAACVAVRSAATFACLAEGSSGSTAIELRSADFSPPRSGSAKTAGSGLKSALLPCGNSLNSMPAGSGRAAEPTTPWLASRVFGTQAVWLLHSGSNLSFPRTEPDSTDSMRKLRPLMVVNSLATTAAASLVAEEVAAREARPVARTNSPKPRTSSSRSGLTIRSRMARGFSTRMGRWIRSGCGV